MTITQNNVRIHRGKKRKNNANHIPLSFWQNSAKTTKPKIGTKLKQSFQTTKNKSLSIFSCKIHCFLALRANPNSF